MAAPEYTVRMQALPDQSPPDVKLPRMACAAQKAGLPSQSSSFTSVSDRPVWKRSHTRAVKMVVTGASAKKYARDVLSSWPGAVGEPLGVSCAAIARRLRARSRHG